MILIAKELGELADELTEFDQKSAAGLLAASEDLSKVVERVLDVLQKRDQQPD